MPKKLTKKEYEAKMAALEPLDDEQRKAITCALLGHSRIVTGCFGYVNCARCGAQLGDLLFSFFDGASEAVVVGHNCQTCRDNFKKLGWEDKILCPDPFKEADAND